MADLAKDHQLEDSDEEIHADEIHNFDLFPPPQAAGVKRKRESVSNAKNKKTKTQDVAEAGVNKMKGGTRKSKRRRRTRKSKRRRRTRKSKRRRK